MCAAVIGDIGWMSGLFVNNSSNEPRILLSGIEADLGESMFTADVVVIITDQVPHAVRRRVLSVASTRGVPVVMRHSSGVPWMRSILLANHLEDGGDAA